MASAEVFVHLSLLEVVPKRGTDRWLIQKFLRKLRVSPEIPGDFTDKDSSLRERHIKVIGSFAITYWFDAPVNIVMVVDIRPADL